VQKHLAKTGLSMSFDFPKMLSHTNLAILWLLMLQLKPVNAETLTQGKQKSDRSHCIEY